jgi:hypothetical protein
MNGAFATAHEKPFSEESEKVSFARKREGQEAALLRTSLSVLPQGILVQNTRQRVDRSKR